MACAASRDLLEQQRELVAAEARQDLARPQAGLQAAGDRHQQAVAHEVAEAVVDVLEAVEVQEQHREPQARFPPVREWASTLEAVQEEGAVREVGQGIVQGGVAELLFRLPALGDVERHSYRAAEHAAGFTQRLQVRLEVPSPPLELELDRLPAQRAPVRVEDAVVARGAGEIFGEAELGQCARQQVSGPRRPPPREERTLSCRSVHQTIAGSCSTRRRSRASRSPRSRSCRCKETACRHVVDKDRCLSAA